MSRFLHVIINYKKSIVLIFSILTIISTALVPLVSVNFNMADYLPQKAQSTTALDLMVKEFGVDVPNVRVMLNKVTVQEALKYKEKISRIEGVTSVSWLDDIVGLDPLLTTPLVFIDESILKNYYQDQKALIAVAIESGSEEKTVAAIRNLIGKENSLEGDAVNTAETQAMATSEVLKAMAILLPIIILILILATTSWLEPLLFLVTIGVAVLINMGTNVLFKEVSFMTQTISPILQLAVSLDYAIFLLHGFKEYISQFSPKKAMELAIKHALPTVTASAVTTIIGFSALMAMRFKIGSDLGINLVKGILLSYISVMVFLPALTLLSYKLIDKTKHRQFIPRIEKVGTWIMKIKTLALIVAVVIVIPAFLAQTNTPFAYGMGGPVEASRIGRDASLIEKQFGKENTLVLLVPRGDAGKEVELLDELMQIFHVKDIVSYAAVVGSEIPAQYVEKAIVDQFYSKNYARLIIYTDTEEEGKGAFDTVQSILEKTKKHYDTYFLAGQSATLYDMKNMVSVDTRLVNLIAIIGIFLVLLVTFKSLSIPLFLLFSIETAIWINLSYAYFTGQHLNFIGYLVISTVQLGATVDYAILLTNRYLVNRKKYLKNEAMKVTIENNLAAIMTSASILATAGFILALTSSNPIISELGMLLGRGTLLSFVMVLFVLPALFILFDKIVQKTTLDNNFHHDYKNN